MIVSTRYITPRIAGSALFAGALAIAPFAKAHCDSRFNCDYVAEGPASIAAAISIGSSATTAQIVVPNTTEGEDYTALVIEPISIEQRPKTKT